MIFVLEILGLSGNLEEVEGDTSLLIFYGRGGMKILFLKNWIFITQHNDLVDLHKSLPGFEL